ncbi:52 kDa repressor of the inhibitor of the protein kinase-like [Hydra vulgaris]|uniref:52 kDa repressor of the inhibitor of the protein kinase-like n=1 Tax=Hydra vulgaris TaxID=6087 RepID=A0ABM4CLB4_HYDVU
MANLGQSLFSIFCVLALGTPFGLNAVELDHEVLKNNLKRKASNESSRLQTKITFQSKSKDLDGLMEFNLKNKSSYLCNQLPIPSFSKVTQCIPITIPSYNYDIGYLISENRRLLLPIIETIILYGRLGLPLRGHRDNSKFHIGRSESPSPTAGNFIELLYFRVKAGDKILEDHLKYHQKIEVVTDKIIEEIKKSQYFSIIANEASDSSNKEQLSLVIRFVDSNLDIKQEFVKFIHCSNGVPGEGLFSVLLKSMSVLSLDIINCRGQSYKGAGAMAGHTKGLSACILNLNEKAIFTHCYSHRLNLAICASCNVQSIRNLLAHVKEVSYFFNLSPTRQQKLEEHID